jgi:hypothetical protein
MSTVTEHLTLVADEVWIVAALLHRETPSATDFLVEAILNRAKRECVAGTIRPGVYVHIVQHCVANRPPNPGRYRMLFETRKNYRRLFRAGDSYDPRREGSKTVPERDRIPEKYGSLLDWYAQEYVPAGRSVKKDSILDLLGSGKEIWADEDADEYVRRLREGWD